MIVKNRKQTCNIMSHNGVSKSLFQFELTTYKPVYDFMRVNNSYTFREIVAV